MAAPGSRRVSIAACRAVKDSGQVPAAATERASASHSSSTPCVANMTAPDHARARRRERPQRHIQSPLRRSFQCEVAGIRTNRSLQRANLIQRCPQRIAKAVCLHRVPARIELPSAHRQRRQHREECPADRIAMHQSMIEKCQRQSLGVRTPAIATVSPIRWQAGCCPHHTGSALQPGAGRSPTRGIAIHHSYLPRWRGLAGTPAGVGQDRAGPPLACATLRPARPDAPAHRIARSPLHPLPLRRARRICGTPRTAPLPGNGTLPPGNARCRWLGRPPSVPESQRGSDHRPDFVLAICGASVSRTRNRTNACGV